MDCKLGRGKVLSEKEHMKLQTKRKKSESAVRKCDMEYYAAAIKSERSRYKISVNLQSVNVNLQFTKNS